MHYFYIIILILGFTTVYAQNDLDYAFQFPKKIEWLYLENLSELPESIHKFKNLTILHIKKGNLTKLPESIGKLKKLRTLIIHNNNLVSLPESIGSCTSLANVSLDSNQITTLPESIGNLSRLYSFSAKNNKLEQLPKSFKNLDLGELDLQYNYFKEVPISICDIKYLHSIKLNFNQIESIPSCITNLGEHVYVDLKESNTKTYYSPPRFPGCEDISHLENKNRCSNIKLMEFLYKKIDTKHLSLNEGEKINVIIQITVTEDGEVETPKIIKGDLKGCAEAFLESVKLMSKSPMKWIPAEVQGKKTKMTINLPCKCHNS
jgi:hypothetical protein